MKEGEDSALRLFHAVFTYAFLAMCFTVILGMLFSPFFIPRIFTFSKTAATAEEVKVLHHLTLSLFLVLMPLFLLQCFSDLFSVLLSAYKRFFLPALAGGLTGLTIIAILFLVPKLGIYGLALGTVLGISLTVAVLAVHLRLVGVRFRFSLDRSHPGFKRVARLFWPLLIGAFLGINLLVDMVMASSLLKREGSVAALNWAHKMVSIPTFMFIYAISTAVFPYFSEQAAAGKTRALKRSFNRAVRLLGFIVLPATVGIIVLARPIVQIYLQRGAFTTESTEMTTQAMWFYALGLFFFAYGFVNGRIYTVLGDTKTLMWMSLFSVAVNIPLNLLFMRWWAHAGIALSTSVTYTLSNIIKYALLRRKMGALGTGKLCLALGRMLAVALVMGAVAYLVLSLLEPRAGLLWAVLGAVASGAAGYFLISHLIGSQELKALLEIFRRRVGR
jgi:putative peptidoglycan lipid II flippase